MATRRRLLQSIGAGSLLLASRSRHPARALATDDPALRPAHELAGLIRRREISCEALLERYLQRIQRFNPALNAVVWLDPDGARQRARAADRALDRGEYRGPLHGLPMTVKDTFAVAGMPTTSGNPLYRQHRPGNNALAVQRLLAAGAVIMGRSNVPIDAGDWQSFNGIYGTTNNPWDPSLTPGGSSGGAAVAVATGLTALELGSDFGGSIRIPAHFSGIYGHKPSYGVVPYRGHIPPPPGVAVMPEMAVAGPLARSALDLQLAMQALTTPAAGEDRDVAARLSPAAPRPLRDYRVAVWLDDPHAPLDAALRPPLRQTVAALRGAGVTVDEDARPAVSLAEIHGVYGDLVRRVLRGHGPADLDRRRDALRDTMAAFFANHDILLMPVAPVAAFPHDHSLPMAQRRLSVNGVDTQYIPALTAWISLASAARLPATSAPVGFTDAGLPAGIQIVGPYLGDWATLDFAAQLAGVVGGYTAPPDHR